MGLAGLSAGLTTGCVLKRPVASAPTSSDLREIAWSDHLTAYFDTALGAEYTTLSPTMLATGANPALTLSGNLAGRPIRVEFPVGGTLGTMQYAVSFIGGGGTSYADTTQWPITGTSSASSPTIDLGDGTFLTFAAGTYTATTSNHTTSYFEAKVATWKELQGITAFDLTDSVLSTSGPVFDWFGVNCALNVPSLRFNGSMLANGTGLGDTLGGLNTPFYIVGTAEVIVKATSGNALRFWSASHSGSANNTKNTIGSYTTGPTFTPASRWGNLKIDNASASVTAYSTASDGGEQGDVQNDWSGHVHEWMLSPGGIFTHKLDGIILCQKSWTTATAVSLDRLCLGGNALGASAPTNFQTMWWKRFAIYDTPPSNDDADTIRVACA